MKLKIKKAVAAMLSMTIICSTMTPRIDSRILLKPELIADAASSCVSFDEATGTLTLSGNIVVDEVIAYANNDAVKKVVAASGTVLPKECNALFYQFKATAIDLSNADTSNVTNMQSMFRDCSSLESLDVSSFDTTNVYYFDNMFCNCSSLPELDVSNFITTSARKMDSMFLGCSNLNELDVSNFDTSNVDSFGSMFTSCSKLKELDLSNFNTSNCWGMMTSMFAGCSSLEKVDVSSFNVIHVYLMDSMFDGCTSLTELDLSSFSTKYISSMSSMFRNCKNLETIYVSGEWSTESARFGLGGMFDMFEGCNKIKGGNGTTYGEYPELYGMMSRIDTDGAPGYLTAKGEVPEKESVFFDKETGTLYLKGEIIHKEVREYRLSPFIKSVVAEEGAVLPEKCGALFSQFKAESIDLSKADESKVTGMDWMFSECTALNELELGNIDTSQCTDMSCMFYKCSGIEELDLSSLDTRNVRDLSSMFSLCSSLKRLDISNFDTGSCETTSGMFTNCSSLEGLDVSSFDTSKINDFASMFGGCENLKELDVSGFRTGSARDMRGMFARCSSLEEIDVSNFDTSNVKEISNMFYGCSNLTVLDLSSFDTRKVYRLDFMFEDCSKLKTIYVSDNWNDGIPSHKYYTEGIFRGCFNLVGGNGTVYDVYHTEMDRACIDTPETPGYLTSVNDIKNTPIILIPGIMGSRLFIDPNCNIRFWDPEIHPIFKDREVEIFQTGLNQKDVYVRDVYVNQNTLDESKREYGARENMKTFVDKLCEKFPNRPIYVFSYDFRKSNVDSAEKLNELIERLCPSNTNKKVDIVAHSMGGIVASQYYKKYGDDKLNNVITCATPYEGAPKIINVQYSGDVLDKWYGNWYLQSIGLDTEAIKKFVTTSQLVPTERYFNELRRIHNAFPDIIPMQEYDGFSNVYPIKSFENYKNYLKAIFEIDDKSTAIENAISFQKSLLGVSDCNCLYDYEKAYFVIGKNIKTISSMDFAYDGTGSWEGLGPEYYLINLNYTNNGDGTVPYLSASMLSKLDPDSDNVEAFKNTHLGLLQDTDVIEWIETILDGKPAPVKSSVSTPSPYAVIRVACPVDVEISDGNDILSSVDGAESFDASFGRLDLIGRNNEIKMICMDENTNLDINLTGTGTGTMDYTIRHYSADEKLLDERTFENVPITDKTVIKTKADNNEVTVLSIDNDGDGVVDDTWTAKKNEIIKSSDSDKTETITSSTTITTVAATTTAANTTTTTKIATTATTSATTTTTTTTTASTTTTTKIATTTTAANTTTTTKDTATTTTSATTTTKASTSTTVQSTTVTTTTASTTTTIVPATKKVLGDIDGNGILDAVDASKILGSYAKYSTGSKAPTEDDLAVCDVNKDGYIDAVDASKVLAFYAHTSTGGKLSLEEFMKK